MARSKFYGNSTSAILDGTAILTLLPRGEDYTLTVPYAHCKGILMGTLTMELGGKVTIDCEKTGYHTEIEFKLKPFLGGVEQTNLISGRLKLGKETLATIDGYWDSIIYIKDRRTGVSVRFFITKHRRAKKKYFHITSWLFYAFVLLSLIRRVICNFPPKEEQVLFNPNPTVRKTRLRRYTVPVDQQGEFESERLWQHVSAAILRDDLNAATEEKTTLEEAQRGAATFMKS